jgi:hypothetical protein
MYRELQKIPVGKKIREPIKSVSQRHTERVNVASLMLMLIKKAKAS